MAALMMAGVFLIIALLVYHLKSINTKVIGRFPSVEAAVLFIGIILNFLLRLPALPLTIAAGLVIFNS